MLNLARFAVLCRWLFCASLLSSVKWGDDSCDVGFSTRGCCEEERNVSSSDACVSYCWCALSTCYYSVTRWLCPGFILIIRLLLFPRTLSCSLFSPLVLFFQKLDCGTHSTLTSWHKMYGNVKVAAFSFSSVGFLPPVASFPLSGPCDLAGHLRALFWPPCELQPRRGLFSQPLPWKVLRSRFRVCISTEEPPSFLVPLRTDTFEWYLYLRKSLKFSMVSWRTPEFF